MGISYNKKTNILKFEYRERFTFLGISMTVHIGPWTVDLGMIGDAIESATDWVQEKIAQLMAMLGFPTINYFVTWDWFETVCITEGLSTIGKSYSATGLSGTGLQSGDRFSKNAWRLDSSDVFLPRPDSGWGSANPWTCMIPGMEHWVMAGTALGDVKTDWGIENAGGFGDLGGTWKGDIKSILLNTNYIWTCYLDSETINEFVMKVAEGVNHACGGFWDLKLVEDPLDPSRLMVVDLKTVGKITSVPELDMGTTVSIAREWGMDTDIDDSIKHSIMMGSNASAGKSQNTNEPVKVWNLYGSSITDHMYAGLSAPDTCCDESKAKNNADCGGVNEGEKADPSQDLKDAMEDLCDNIADDTVDTALAALKSFFSGDNEFYSTIGERSVIIPIGFTCKMDGIGSLLWGMSFSVKQINDAGLLPKGHSWMITDISHNIDQKDWTIDLKTRLLLTQAKSVSNYSGGTNSTANSSNPNAAIPNSNASSPTTHNKDYITNREYTCEAAKKALAAKGYKWHPWWNLIGVRNMQAGTKVHDIYDDTFILWYQDGDMQGNKVGDPVCMNYSCTTKPGARHMTKGENKYSMGNVLGTLIMQPGQYKYRKGTHRGYNAFRQHSGIYAWRDNDEDGMYSYDTSKTYWVAGDDKKCENGSKNCSGHGVNIHRSAATGTSRKINGYSAGCQVFANANDQLNVMSAYEKIYKVPKNSADDMKTFTYTLLNSTDIQKYEDEGTAKDSKGRVGKER